MPANLSRVEKIELVELLEEKKRREQTTVVGIVCPEKGLTHSIKKVSGQWITTLEKPDVFLPAKLERVIKSKKRFICIVGGRGSGKSISGGGICLIKAKDEGVKTYCLREYQSSIKNSIHALLKSEIDRLGFDDFESFDNTIRYKGVDAFQFAGIARNVESIKSAHGFGIFEIEESQFLSAESLETLTPTARNKPNEGLPIKFGGQKELREIPEDISMMFIANPKASEDPFSQRFIVPFKDALDRDGYYEDDLHLIVVMNYTDNPWYEESGLEEERQFDYENKPRAKYDHIWRGAFSDEVDDAIIQSEWFDACIDAHKKIKGWEAKGMKVCAHDPSDKGGDPKGIARRHGTIVEDVQERTIGDVNEGCDWATDYAIEHAVDMFVFDEDGLGASLRRQINTALSGKNIRVEGFKGSHGVDRPEEHYLPADEYADQSKPRLNEEVFRNKRSQKYINLRDRVYLTYRAVVHDDYNNPDDMISFSSNIKKIVKLRSELCRIPTKPNGAGFIQIMTKEEMKTKHKIKSPNMADSVYMLWGIDPVVKKKWEKINYPQSSIV